VWRFNFSQGVSGWISKKLAENGKYFERFGRRLRIPLEATVFLPKKDNAPIATIRPI
jgi:hypothetical protein